MKIETKPFLAAFEKVAHLAQRRTSIPVLNSVKLETKGGLLEISGSDLDCHAVAKCECSGTIEPICVSAAMLGGLIKSAAETISLTVNKTLRLVFESNGVASLSCLEGEEFPHFPSDKATAVGVNTKDLAECIEGVSWAANSKESDLTGAVWVELKAKSITCASTDKHRFGYVKRGAIAADNEFMFQAKFSADLCAALRCDGAELLVSENHVICRSPLYSVAMRQIAGKYYNLGGMMNLDRVAVGDLDSAPVLAALSTIRLVANGEPFFPVSVKFGDKGTDLEFVGNSSEYKTTLAGPTNGRAIRFDASLAQDVFRNIGGEKLKAELNSQCLILHNGDFLAAIALLADKKP